MTITIDRLTKQFENHIILDNFSAQFKSGEKVAIIGPSGCGKTTLLRILAGLDKDYEGFISGTPSKCSFLFQENRLLDWKNIADNIHFVVKDVLSQEETEKRLTQLLSLSYLTEHKDKFPAELSGGMQRRTALCRSFIYPSELLLMDEPFSGLDSKMKNTIADAFFSLVQPSMILLVVSHDEMIINKCDRKIILE